MEKNFIDQFYGNMDYNTYNTIRNITGSASIGLFLVTNFLLNRYPIVHDVAYALPGMLCAYYVGSDILKRETRTKDVTEIKAIYDEIIKNYNKMNKVFDLNNPVEIHTMFNYLLYKGYLSKGKKFEFGDANARDIETLYGANVVNGQGVCRHIALMLKDVFNDYGINSNVLLVYVRKLVIYRQTEGDRPEQTIEQLYDFVRKYINDEEMKKFFNELIEKEGTDLSLSYSYEDDKKNTVKRKGNHLITLANKDGISYFLDPTQTRMYKLSSDHNILTDNVGDKIKICYGNSTLYERFKDIKSIKEKILLPGTSFEEDQAIVERTRKICETNQDIFEQFYNENSEMYEELSDKFMLLKKTKILIRRPEK